jgi:MATE family multidrug resistance protein
MAGSWRPHVVDIVRLAVPLALVQAGASLVGVIDTAVMGRTTPAQLAGVGLGNSMLFALSIFGMGVVVGTEPLIAQALGGGDVVGARRTLRQGVWTALLVMPLILAAAALLVVPLPRFGVDPDVVPHARRYVLVRLPGVLPFLLYGGIKAWLQAHGRTQAPVVGVLVGIAVELALDVVLVYGVPSIGLPALGVTGAGLAHVITSVVRLSVVVFAAEQVMKDASVAGEPPASSLAERWARMRAAFVVDELRAVARIGVPLGFTMALEVAVFAFAALTMGRLGAQELAAHQVAIQCASTTFNVMVGLGSATSVVVGRAIGARDKPGALRAGLAGLALSVVFMCFTGALFVFAGAELARLLTDKADVVAEAAALLMVAAAFQLSDGLQTVASGALRGAGDTRATFVIHLVSHWGVGMPFVLFLAARLGAPGVWWGLTLGLTAAAVALVSRFVVKARAGYEPLRA